MEFKNVAGNIEARLIRNQEELTEAMRLRYRALILAYNHKNANETGLDYDPIDDYCDHLIAIDTNINRIIGTYRLIRKEHVDTFITENEYDITAIKKYNLLEISRAVVDDAYRNGSAIGLLWRSIIQYAKYYHSDFMIGTASFYGLDPEPYAHGFSYLYHYHLSPSDILCHAKEPKIPLGLLEKNDINIQLAKQQLPPLVKGYLRLGCTIGDGIYVDEAFNSIDVLIVLEIKAIDPRYLKKMLGL